MKIFLSYPSQERPVAERVNLALLAHGHDVFFDRADLEAGLEYDQAIARAIADADLFVFFITPSSVEPGRYTLTELGLAERRWPHPGGRVLPVMVRPTEMASVPAYLRAVNIFSPRGEVVAETAHEVQRIARSRGWPMRVWRAVRSPVGIVSLVSVGAIGAIAWVAREMGILGSAAVRLPVEVRQNARAAAPLVDSGFVIATANPPRLVEFTENGAQATRAIELIGEPVSIERTPSQLLVVTRGRDGVMVLDAKQFRVVQTALLDPSSVKAAPGLVDPPRRSGDVESVAPYKGDLMVTTGDRDGEPTVLRYPWYEKVWRVATWTVDTAGFGPEAKGVRLRNIGEQLWGVRMRGDSARMYHFVDPWIRIDRFDGREYPLVRCATDVAASAAGNPMFLSCDNELQEVSVQARQLTLLRTWPPFPVERTAATVMHHLLATDGGSVVAAFNTEGASPSNSSARAQVIAMDTSGVMTRVLDEHGAVVRSLAVTARRVVAVLRRADGSYDVVVGSLTPSP